MTAFAAHFMSETKEVSNCCDAEKLGNYVAKLYLVHQPPFRVHSTYKGGEYDGSNNPPSQVEFI